MRFVDEDESGRGGKVRRGGTEGRGKRQRGQNMGRHTAWEARGCAAEPSAAGAPRGKSSKARGRGRSGTLLRVFAYVLRSMGRA